MLQQQQQQHQANTTTTVVASASNAVVATKPFSLFGFMRRNRHPESASLPTSAGTADSAATAGGAHANAALGQQQLQQKLKQQKNDHKTITQYIKSFEAIVIKSLRQYTFTTSVNLQARILELLNQLIFLKVIY